MSENIVTIEIESPQFEPKNKRNSFLFRVIVRFILNIRIRKVKREITRLDIDYAVGAMGFSYHLNMSELLNDKKKILIEQFKRNE